MTIILFIIVLLVTVIVHEWGHFFAARKSGMTVEEFGFGIPPRLFSWKKGETTYSINALPIGGFVKIAGENGLEGAVPPERQFDTKPWYLKSLVLIAGVVMNIVLAFVLFTVAYSIGMPTTSSTGTPTVVSVTADGLANAAGLSVGDTITSVVANGVEVSPLTTESLHDSISTSTGAISIDYLQGGQTKNATLEFPENTTDRKIGIAVEPIETIRLPLFTAMHAAVLQIGSIASGIWNTLGMLIGGLFGGEAVQGLMGPVGLAREVGGAASIGFAYLLAFTAAISINLAVLNILPFPALDGGRLIVVLLEAITRRRFSPNVVGIIHTVGFLLLLVLMLVLTVGDVRRLF
ncbi:M50 family metallopeptidase [Patescibacteria group bacterium]|nr:M50 family metallopeptidase [Patescibacteria group bacterium]